MRSDSRWTVADASMCAADPAVLCGTEVVLGLALLGNVGAAGLAATAPAALLGSEGAVGLAGVAAAALPGTDGATGFAGAALVALPGTADTAGLLGAGTFGNHFVWHSRNR